MPLSQEQIVHVLLSERTRLLAWSWSVLRDGHWSEDVFQDLLMKALESDAEFETESRLISWGWQVTRNRVFELLRRSKRQAANLDDMVLRSLAAEMQNRDMRNLNDRIDALGICLEQLTDRSRRIVRMRHVDGLNARDIAASVDGTMEAIYKTLARTYTTLAECIDRRLRESEGGSA